MNMEISGLGKTPGTTGLSVRGSDLSAVSFRIQALEAELSQLKKDNGNRGGDTQPRIAAIESQLSELNSMQERLKNGQSASESHGLRRASAHGISQPGVGLNYDMRV